MNKNIFRTLGLVFIIIGLTFCRNTNWLKIICIVLGATLSITSFIIRLKSKK